MRHLKIFIIVCGLTLMLSGCLTDDVKKKKPTPTQDPIVPEVVEPVALVPGWYQGNVRSDFTRDIYAGAPDQYYTLLLDQGDGKVQVWTALMKSHADSTQALGFGVQKYLADYDEQEGQLSSASVQTLISEVVAPSVNEMVLGRYYDPDVELYGSGLILTHSGQSEDEGYNGTMIVDKESLPNKNLYLSDASLVMPEDDFARPANLSTLVGKWELSDHTLRARFPDEPTEPTRNFYKAYLDVTADGSLTITYSYWFDPENFTTFAPGQICVLEGTVTASDKNNYYSFTATTPPVVSHEPPAPLSYTSPGNPCELAYGRGAKKQVPQFCSEGASDCTAGSVIGMITRPDWDARVELTGVMIIGQPEKLFIMAGGTQARGEEIHDNSGRIFTGVWQH